MRVLTSSRRVVVALAMAISVTLALLFSASSFSGEYRSGFVSAASLEAQGIELVPVPATVPTARVDAATARASAKAIARLEADPRETFRILARPTPQAAPRSAWLFLFEGGRHAGSVGPPDGAATRTFAVSHTGVLIDDQTGELLFWFQGGSFTP
jgi:hypothetical protein